MEENGDCPAVQHALKYSGSLSKMCSANHHNKKSVLCLCCETNRFPSLWAELRNQKSFCDGIISLRSGSEIKVHRIVLSACSSYFKASFTYNNINNDSQSFFRDDQKSQSNETIVINIDLSDETMELILDYAYGGDCNITWTNVEELLAAADRYEVVGLIRLCCKFLLKELSNDNCIGIYLYAKHYFCKELENYARQFILRNFCSVLKESGELKQLDATELRSILSDEQLNVYSEEIVFNAIREWTESDPVRSVHLPDLIPCIRFGLIGQEIFKNCLESWPLMKENIDYRKLRLPLSCRPRIPNQIIFVIGGWTQGSPTNSIEIYDTRADLWLNMKYTDATRAYHGVCTIDQKVYVLGGFDGYTHYNSMRCFDPVKYLWEEKACMYHPRCYVSVAVLDRKIYALGGYNGHTRLDTVERYDTDRNQWEMLSPMKRLRSDAAAVALGENIYVVGGFNGTEVLNSCEMYNPLTDNWTLVSFMLNPRSGVGLVVCDEYMYAIGGFSGESRLSTVERYSIKDPTWRFVADMMVPRSNCATVVIEGVIFVIGGFNGSHTISFVERYDTVKNSWKAAKQMNFSRSAQSACVLKDLPNIKAYSLQCRDMLSPETPCFLKQTKQSSNNNTNNINNHNHLIPHDINNNHNHLFINNQIPNQNELPVRANNENVIPAPLQNPDNNNNNAVNNSNGVHEEDLNNLFWEHGAPEPFLNSFFSHHF